jgi:hypothetical protein
VNVLNYFPFSGWWKEPFGPWVGKLISVQCSSILTSTVVIMGIVTYFGTSPLSLLMIGLTITVNWLATICGVYIGGIIGCSGTITYLGT